MPISGYLAAVEFRILGPLTVVDDQGNEVVLHGTRLRALLAVLLVRPGHVVAVDRIAEELWGDDQPIDAAAALHSQVSRLRATLRDAGAGDCIEPRAPGYVLTVASSDVDARRFEDGARSGHALLASGSPEQASEELSAALALWRGEVLADITAGDDTGAERARLEELRRTAVEDRVDA